MRVCLYIRLSMADKDLQEKDESNSIANQRALLHQYLEKHREFHPYETVEFVDDGFSGTNGNRPGFERMIEFLKSGGAELVLCKDLSRFFRNYVEMGGYLDRFFPSHGIRLIAVNDGYDSDDYKGTTASMDVTVKSIFNALYSRDLSQKIRTANEARAHKGQFIGNFAPYGYLKDPQDKHHLILDPVAAPIVRRIFESALDGCTTGEIARALNNDHVEPPAAHFHRLHPENQRYKKRTSSANSWTNITVGTILKRREYTGALVSYRKNWKNFVNQQTTMRDESEWITVLDCHEAIISVEMFEKAQSAFQKQKKTPKKRREYLLRSLVRCGVCGRAMPRSKVNVHTPIFYCCDRSRYTEGSACPTYEHINEAELERIVVQSLSDLLQTIVDCDRSVQDAVAKTAGSAEKLRQSLLSMDKAIQRIENEQLEAYDLYADGNLTREGFIKRRSELDNKLQRLTGRRQFVQDQLAAMEQPKNTELHEAAEIAQEYLQAEEVTNQMLLKFIDRVNVFSSDHVEIEYNFNGPFLDNLAEIQRIADTA